MIIKGFSYARQFTGLHMKRKFKSFEFHSYVGLPDREFKELEKFEIKSALFILHERGSLQLDENMHRASRFHVERRQRICFSTTLSHSNPTDVTLSLNGNYFELTDKVRNEFFCN